MISSESKGTSTISQPQINPWDPHNKELTPPTFSLTCVAKSWSVQTHFQTHNKYTKILSKKMCILELFTSIKVNASMVKLILHYLPESRCWDYSGALCTLTVALNLWSLCIASHVLGLRSAPPCLAWDSLSIWLLLESGNTNVAQGYFTWQLCQNHLLGNNLFVYWVHSIQMYSKAKMDS